MSNKTQLQTNNTALASLTDRVLAAKDTAAALPDAGSGGAVETCTVTLNYPVSIQIIRYMALVDGEATLQAYSVNSKSITIENVICGGIFIVDSNYIYTPITTITGGGSFVPLNNIVFQAYVATTVAGGTMVVNMIDDD